jgi:hypothetical protein
MASFKYSPKPDDILTSDRMVCSLEAFYNMNRTSNAKTAATNIESLKNAIATCRNQQCSCVDAEVVIKKGVVYPFDFTESVAQPSGPFALVTSIQMVNKFFTDDILPFIKKQNPTNMKLYPTVKFSGLANPGKITTPRNPKLKSSGCTPVAQARNLKRGDPKGLLLCPTSGSNNVLNMLNGIVFRGNNNIISSRIWSNMFSSWMKGTQVLSTKSVPTARRPENIIYQAYTKLVDYQSKLSYIPGVYNTFYPINADSAVLEAHFCTYMYSVRYGVMRATVREWARLYMAKKRTANQNELLELLTALAGEALRLQAVNARHIGELQENNDFVNWLSLKRGQFTDYARYQKPTPQFLKEYCTRGGIKGISAWLKPHVDTSDDTWKY